MRFSIARLENAFDMLFALRRSIRGVSMHACGVLYFRSSISGAYSDRLLAIQHYPPAMMSMALDVELTVNFSVSDHSKSSSPTMVSVSLGMGLLMSARAAEIE